jgi:hypothetical protein
LEKIMPLVKPKDKEKREDFMSRCMSDDKTISEYPATDQRLAVCSSQYENGKKEEYSMNDIEKMGEAIKSLTDVISSKKKPKDEDMKEARDEDMYDNPTDARDKAKEIGCVGVHSMTKEHLQAMVLFLVMKIKVAILCRKVHLLNL